MKVVTRFSPTPNGPLHLGHLFTLLVNEQFAHLNGGKFIVRFDDIVQMLAPFPKDKIQRIAQQQREIIEWFEIEVDEWIWESDLLPETERTLKLFKYVPLPQAKADEEVVPLFIKEPGWFAIPYVPKETVERVIMDNMIGATHIIRGDDFCTEYSLYCYFCQTFNFPIPEFVFLPRLAGAKGDISKTGGGYTLVELRADGYTAQQLKAMMRKACLIVPGNGWQLHNIKSYPRINI